MHERRVFRRSHSRAGCFGTLLIILAATTVGGCQVPDLAGFSQSAITVRTSLGEAKSIYRPFVVQYDQTEIKTFDDDWLKVEAAADALVEYAQSLEAIAAAGQKGAEGAQKLMESVNKLAGRFDAAGIAGTAGDIFKAVYGETAKAIAAHTLAETTREAQPLIDRICKILADKVADNFGKRLATIYTAVKSRIDDSYPDIAKAAQYERLVATRADLLSQLGTSKPDTWPESTVKALGDLDAVLGRLQPRYEAWQQAINEAEALRDRQEALLRQLGVTIRAFAAEHGSLRATVEANRSFTLTNVQFAAGELTKLIDRIEEIRNHGR